MGGQALGLAWSKKPFFRLEMSDYSMNKNMAACEIRGQKALQFPSTLRPDTKIERGLIHSFVRYSDSYLIPQPTKILSSPTQVTTGNDDDDKL